MGLLIGMDEAGYGPNLGPLVITLTAWTVPGHPAECELWNAFGDVVSRQPDANNGRLYIDDSKRVYQSSGSLAALERPVLAALRMIDLSPSDYDTLCNGLANGRNDDAALRKDDAVDPALKSTSLTLPCCPNIADDVASAAGAWRQCCRRSGISLQAIHSDIVWPARFNRLLNSYGNKAEVLTRMSLQLLSRIWTAGAPQRAEADANRKDNDFPAFGRRLCETGKRRGRKSKTVAHSGSEAETPTLIFADKHGGRNRYDGYLQEIANGEMIFRLQESPDMSRYRIGNDEIRFCRGGESQLPVALASMTSKYLRELSMMLFNRFWERHVPGIRPTKGYPVDAKRFRAEIAEVQQRLGIADAVLWRER